MNSADTYKCDRCGLESTVKEGFIQRSRFLNPAPQTLCYDCAIKSQSRSLLLSYLILPLLGIFLFLAFPGSPLGKLYLELSAALVLGIPLIVLHELSHALAAYLLGWRVFAIHLGAGQVVATLRFLGFPWYLHPLPLGGATLLGGPEQPDYRLRLFLTYLAGPGFHLLLIVWLALLLQGGLAAHAQPWLIEGAVIGLWINGLLLLSNLYPRKVAASAGVAQSDGRAMIDALTMPAADLRKFIAAYYVMSAVDAIDRGDLPAAQRSIEAGAARYPAEPYIINGIGYVYTALDDYAMARAAFLRLYEMDGGTIDQPMKYIVLNNIAFADLMLEDEELRQQAADFSAQSYQNMPWIPEISGTRGAVLVWLGQVDEGIDLLKKAMSRSPNRKGRALDACFIARAEVRRGNPAEAKKYLDSACRLHPTCILIERVRSDLERS